MKIRRRKFKKSTEPQSFWPSFTDVMSTIALVLFFLMLLAYIQNIITGKNLEFLQLQLDETEQDLVAKHEAIQLAERRLQLIEDEVKRTQAEVERGQEKLTLSQREIEQQRRIIAASNEELGNLRTKLEQVAVLRLDILEKVKQSIEQQIGSTNERGEQLVTIGDNANIVINEGLVFDYNSYIIKTEGRELIRQFAIAFEKILDDQDVRANIDAINVEGHTDDTGSSLYNRDLSVKRSTSVVNYMMQTNPSLEIKYGEYFAATGYSEFRPIALGTSEAARQRNRRIEISVIIKDANVQTIITDYLKDIGNN